MKFPRDTHKLIALVEGAIDLAAVELICDGGALSLHRDGGVPEAIAKCAGPDPFLLFEETKEKLNLSPDVDDCLSNAVYAGVTQREEAAYLLGLAVGRRLGAQPLTKGA